MAEGSNSPELAYTSAEIQGEKTLTALRKLKLQLREEERTEDIRDRHPLNGAIYNLNFINSLIHPLVQEVFERTSSKVDFNPRIDLFTAERLRYYPDRKLIFEEDDIGGGRGPAIDGQTFQSLWEKKINRSLISHFGKMKRTQIIDKFEKEIIKATK